jgi:hypothetical protein
MPTKLPQIARQKMLKNNQEIEGILEKNKVTFLRHTSCYI